VARYNVARPQAHRDARGNQVWTWDITKLATLEKGVFLHALRDHRSVQPLRRRLDGGCEGVQAPGGPAVCRQRRASRHRAGAHRALGPRRRDEERHPRRSSSRHWVPARVSVALTSPTTNAFSEAPIQDAEVVPT